MQGGTGGKASGRLRQKDIGRMDRRAVCKESRKDSEREEQDYGGWRVIDDDEDDMQAGSSERQETTEEAFPWLSESVKELGLYSKAEGPDPMYLKLAQDLERWAHGLWAQVNTLNLGAKRQETPVEAPLLLSASVVKLGLCCEATNFWTLFASAWHKI